MIPLMKRVSLVFAFVVLVTGTAAGCADGDEPSKEEYVSSLNAMCEDFNARERKVGEPRTIADLATKGPRIQEAFESAIADKVGSLEAPEEIADQADRLVAIADEQRDVLSALVNAARANDFPGVREFASKNAALNRESSSIARDLGADACG